MKKYETVKVDDGFKDEMTKGCMLGASMVPANASPAEGIYHHNNSASHRSRQACRCHHECKTTTTISAYDAKDAIKMKRNLRGGHHPERIFQNEHKNKKYTRVRIISARRPFLFRFGIEAEDSYLWWCK